MKRFGLVGITTWAFLFLFDVPKVAAQQITINVKQEGQAAPGVSVVFLAANMIKPTAEAPNNTDESTLNLSNIIKPRVTVTDASGTGVLDLSNIIKPHGQVEVQIVVRTCQDGKNVVYVLQEGQKVPPQDEKCVDNNDCKCKDRAVAGLFLISDGNTLNVGINPESIDVQVTQTEVAGGTSQKNTKGNARTEDRPVYFVLEGAVGKAYFPGPGCGGITQNLLNLGFDMTTCRTNASDIAFKIDAQIRFLRYFGVSGGFLDDGSVTQSATASVSVAPGVMANTSGSFGSLKGVTFEGLGILPITQKLALTVNLGLQDWNVRSGNTFVLVVPGFPDTTSSVAQKNNGVNLVAGATVEYWVTRFFGFNARYVYARNTDGPTVNEKDHKMLFGAMVSLWRPKHVHALF